MSEGYYLIYVHPDVERDLRNIQARYKWAEHYRAWRKAGKPGDAVEKFKVMPMRSPGITGELGEMQGIRFIKGEGNG